MLPGGMNEVRSRGRSSHRADVPDYPGLIPKWVDCLVLALGRLAVKALAIAAKLTLLNVSETHWSVTESLTLIAVRRAVTGNGRGPGGRGSLAKENPLRQSSQGIGFQMKGRSLLGHCRVFDEPIRARQHMIAMAHPSLI